MKERPILFSGAMVKAILSGAKTQTRRIVKRTDSGRVKAVGSPKNWHLDDPNAVNACPYGQPGDRLWVRERVRFFTVHSEHYDSSDFCDCDGIGIRYSAGGAKGVPCGEVPDGWWFDGDRDYPSIHMPRWASRIMLEIVSVRVERLQDISERDAMAEGIEVISGTPNPLDHSGCWRDYTGSRPYWNGPIDSFHSLWESIYGPGAWEVNPWMWVVEFKRVKE